MSKDDTYKACKTNISFLSAFHAATLAVNCLIKSDPAGKNYSVSSVVESGVSSGLATLYTAAL